MLCRKLFMAVMSGIVTLAVVLSGCSGDDGAEGPMGPEGPQGPPGPTILKPFILAEITPPTVSDTMASAMVSMTYLSGVPTAKINETNIPFRLWYTILGSAYLADYLPSEKHGDSIRLTAEFPKSDGTDGTANARIIIPEQFEIVSHDTSVFILTGIGDNLRVHWSQSAGADAYGVSFELSYNYELESGDTGRFVINLDTFITDTTIFFPDSVLYPYAADMVSMWNFNEDFSVSAFDGPVLPGTQANVTGDAIGVLFSRVYGGQLDFTTLIVLTAGDVPEQPKRPDISQVLYERLSQRFDSQAL